MILSASGARRDAYSEIDQRGNVVTEKAESDELRPFPDSNRSRFMRGEDDQGDEERECKPHAQRQDGERIRAVNIGQFREDPLGAEKN